MPQYQRMSSLDELLMLLDHQMVREQIRKISSNALHVGIEIPDGDDNMSPSTSAVDNIDDTHITDDFVHVVLLPVKKETFVQKQRRTGRVDGGLQGTQFNSQISIDKLVDIIDHKMVGTDPDEEDNAEKHNVPNPNSPLEHKKYDRISYSPSEHPKSDRLSSLDELLSLLDHNMVRDQIRKISVAVTPNEGSPSDFEISESSESGDHSKKGDYHGGDSISPEISTDTTSPSNEHTDINEDRQRKRVTFDPNTEERAAGIPHSGQYQVVSNANSDDTNEVVRRKVTPAIGKDVTSPISVDSKHPPHKGLSFLNDFLSLLKNNVLVRERIRKISEHNMGKFPLSDATLEEGCGETFKMEPIIERHTHADISEAQNSSTKLIDAEREHTKL